MGKSEMASLIRELLGMVLALERSRTIGVLNKR